MNVVFLSPIAWDNSGGAHRPVQFAQELARRGHHVTYVEIEKSRTLPLSPNPRVLNLEQLGWDALNLLRAWYGLSYHAPRDAAERLLAALPAAPEPGIVICAAPFRPVLPLAAALAARGYALVYDVLDDISEMRALGAYCYDDLAETYLAEHAALVVTLSPRLCAKFRAHPNVTLVRDGVDLAPFRNPDLEGPQDLRGLNHLERGAITLGFWGTMWEYNLDLPLLQTLTRARTDWQWHFVGAYDLDPARPSLAQALAAPNVHFHPSVARPALARAARSFDVCILPTPVTPFNLARDPLKVYEYLACYKPVVATNLEQLAGMPYVSLSRDAAEFLSNVERAVQIPIARAALDAYLDAQTWSRRTDALLAALERLPRRVPPPEGVPPPQGAMPGAEHELARWHAFTRHLERLVRDREAHTAALEAALRQAGLRARLKRVLGRRAESP